ncbi:Plant invertase/pectin methylesterase inhibitor superfamily protein [Rhynchospora pubera]|uniref:Plant invertase/pectin methylesterase inhibitor superfamily protein n=1 Tax=Rhynchospora pubera TaxID=906938 RepID=A0AAV8EAN1_9POAL|nr:Plant invertase/pectin methylesterase inhibitor superfamily protein [Rhynchospora pubera]
MATIPHLLLLLTLFISTVHCATSSPPTDFIRSSCRITRYPDLCLQSLATYGPAVHRSPRELARFALTVSADRARSAASFVSQLCDKSNQAHYRAGGPVRDCLENMADSVDRLKEAADELARMGRTSSAGFKFHMSNVQTWCSAALTDENTCLDGLGKNVEPTTRSAIRKKVVEVAQVTSNALALVNRVSGSK